MLEELDRRVGWYFPLSMLRRKSDSLNLTSSDAISRTRIAWSCSARLRTES